MSLTANLWPGAPKALPPLMSMEERMQAYSLASFDWASVQEMVTAYEDIGQRLAIALHSAPPLSHDEVAAGGEE